jgi:hypothetical protein
VAAEIAYQNAVANHAISGHALEHQRHVLGHRIEVQRHLQAQLVATGTPAPDGDSEEVLRGREDVRLAEERLELARREVETRFAQKAEAAERLRETHEELKRLG